MIIKISGELDHHSAEAVRDELDKKILAGGENTVIFDLSELTFMDSAGIGVLLGRYKLFAYKRLYISHPGESIHKLLKMSGIYSVMPLYKEEKAQ